MSASEQDEVARSPLRLSVLDQSPISEGSTGPEALANTLDLARLADALGYHRYWVAEHHGTPMLAGASPEVLIGPIAASTSSIRVGSGGVMLPHYSPWKVAESFSVLSALFGDRIDLGLGRGASADAVTTHALQRDRRTPSPQDFAEQLAELVAHIDGRPPPDERFANLASLPGLPSRPEPWLLGSSLQSAMWAAQLGLPYAFGDFINPGGGVDVVNLYRDRFVASQRLAQPRVLVAVWALCADSDEEAERLSAPARMATMLSRRGKAAPVPPVDTALRFIDRHGAGTGRRMVHGSPAAVRSALGEVAADYATDELLVVSVTHEHESRLRSYELLAEAFALAVVPARR